MTRLVESETTLIGATHDMKARFWIAVVLGLLLGCSAANAHHSFAAIFKEGETIAVEGVVTSFSFKNPHILIYLDVTDENGAVTN